MTCYPDSCDPGPVELGTATSITRPPPAHHDPIPITGADTIGLTITAVVLIAAGRILARRTR